MTAYHDQLGAIRRFLHEKLENRERAWEEALRLSRTLIRTSAQTVQALHREDRDRAAELLRRARALVEEIERKFKAPFPEFYYANLIQDALKEFVEAQVVYGVLVQGVYPDPTEMDIPAHTYVRGLAEAIGEFRRRCLDHLRRHQVREAEALFAQMEAIYEVLVSMDYPDAVTSGLRRMTDIARTLLERTRGELTLSLHLFRVHQRLDADDAIPPMPISE